MRHTAMTCPKFSYPPLDKKLLLDSSLTSSILDVTIFLGKSGRQINFFEKIAIESFSNGIQGVHSSLGIEGDRDVSLILFWEGEGKAAVP